MSSSGWFRSSRSSFKRLAAFVQGGPAPSLQWLTAAAVAVQTSLKCMSKRCRAFALAVLKQFKTSSEWFSV
eukprot:5927081-Pyramimonas_sp.AAC.1